MVILLEFFQLQPKCHFKVMHGHCDHSNEDFIDSIALTVVWEVRVHFVGISPNKTQKEVQLSFQSNAWPL